MFAGLLRDEEQRHERRVRDRVVEVPHDLRNRVGVFLRRDDLDDVLDTDRFS